MLNSLSQNKFPTYKSWAEAVSQDFLAESRPRNPAQYSVQTFESGIFLNNGKGSFLYKPFPNEAQTAPVYDMLIEDFLGNSRPDILLVGNNFGNRPEFGPRADQGILLSMNEDDEFDVVPSYQSGFYAPGDVRKIEWIPTALGPVFILARYGEQVLPYLYSRE